MKRSDYWKVAVLSTATLQPHDQHDSISRLLNIKEIYYEPAALDYPRAQAVLSQHPDAQLLEVASHWNIPDLHGNEGAVEDWNRIKRTVLVLGVKKSLCVLANDAF
jgi:hypothetical protein